MSKIWWIPGFRDYNADAMRISSSIQDLENAAFSARFSEERAAENRCAAKVQELNRLRRLLADSASDGSFQERLAAGEFALPD